jgi:hypothetical protein
MTDTLQSLCCVREMYVVDYANCCCFVAINTRDEITNARNYSEFFNSAMCHCQCLTQHNTPELHLLTVCNNLTYDLVNIK